MDTNATRKFLVLFTGRSGGTYFQQSIHNHPEIECSHEIWEAPGGDTFRAMKRLLSVRHKGIRAKGVLLKPNKVPRGALEEYIKKNDVYIVHLWRRNPIKHALSRYNGRRLKGAHRRLEITDSRLALRKTKVHLSEFVVDLLFEQEMERMLEVLLREMPHVLRVSYEDILGDWDATWQCVRRFLGVGNHGFEMSPLKKITPDDLGEAVSNYSDVRGYFDNPLLCNVYDRYFDGW